ncbi:MAG: thiamine-phosphate kinase [Kiritimatiellae bacterium]|nr:thiamine-phosphate kinase [Kiritimatiellia bacterium]MDD4736238.1 thiamine-phosphate kinase [Kiritimatiellia bacterium]
MTTLEQLGERKIIEALARLIGPGRDVITGIGDDCAVVRAGTDDWVITTDPVIEGVHFLSGEVPQRIGHKAVGRVLSDVASMGAEPLWLAINIVAPPTLELAVLEGIYEGANALLARCGGAIIGGDVAQGNNLELHVFGVGRLPAGTALLRSGAKPGDLLYVTGALGGSLLGKHLDFTPRLAEGQWLREQQLATAMIDVSDGLLSEANHLAECSRARVMVDAARVPTAPAAHHVDTHAPLAHALTDGEDFELLFTVPAEKTSVLEQAWREHFETPCTCIGTVEPGGGVHTLHAPEELTGNPGYEHFRLSDSTKNAGAENATE